MKKRILCLVLAVVIAAAAIFFAVYNKYGTSYDYADKDMSKYVSMITDKAFVEGLFDGSVTLKEASAEDIQYAIAAAFLEKNADEYLATEGTFGLYDTLLCNYEITLEDKVISIASKLDPASPTKVQLGADDDFSRLMAALKDKDIADNSYVTFTSGKVLANDILYIDYTVKDGESTEGTGTYHRVVVSGDAYLEDVLTGLTAKFEEQLNSESGITIGTAVDLTVPDATDATKNLSVTVTVKYAARTIVESGAVKEGDTVYFTYSDDGGKNKTEYYGTIGDGMIDTAITTGFTEGLLTLEIGVEGTIEIPAASSEEEGKTYTVTIDYAVPADANDTSREGYRAAEKFFEFTYTYPETSEAKAETDETVTLAGKTVSVRVAVASFYDMSYDYTGVIDILGYEPGDTSNVDKYLTAYAAFVEAKEAYDAGAAKTGDDALTEEELEELLTAMTDAETAMNEAKDAYAAELEDGAEVTADSAAVAAYDQSAKDTAQDAYNEEYSYAVAEIVWDKLLEVAKDAKLPSKAVRVAYNGIIDGYKTDYYDNQDSEPYSNYKTFKSYLKQYVYSGKDYKAEIKSEAQDIVLANVVLYRLVEIYDVELTAYQEMIANLYEQLGSSSYADAVRMAGLFDNAMTAIVESINPAVKSAD
jgi:hypothetical protein